MKLALSRTSKTGTRIGYMRVSTVMQTPAQQEAALEAAGVTKTFSDMCGARDDCPGWPDYSATCDTVVVWKLDRLGRDTMHILQDTRITNTYGQDAAEVAETLANLEMLGGLHETTKPQSDLTL